MPADLAYLEEYDDERTRACNQGRVRSAAAAGQGRGDHAITPECETSAGPPASWSLANSLMQRFMDKGVAHQVRLAYYLRPRTGLQA